MVAVLTVLREERQAEKQGWNAEREKQHAQQQMVMTLIEQQREEIARHRERLLTLETGEGDTPRVKLLNPTLQKMAPGDDTEHILSTSEPIAKQQGWPEEV